SPPPTLPSPDASFGVPSASNRPGVPAWPPGTLRSDSPQSSPGFGEGSAPGLGDGCTPLPAAVDARCVPWLASSRPPAGRGRASAPGGAAVVDGCVAAPVSGVEACGEAVASVASGPGAGAGMSRTTTDGACSAPSSG